MYFGKLRKGYFVRLRTMQDYCFIVWNRHLQKLSERTRGEHKVSLSNCLKYHNIFNQDCLNSANDWRLRNDYVTHPTL